MTELDSQKFVSTTITLYDPTDNESTIAVVSPVDHMNSYGAVPPEKFTSTSAMLSP